MNNLIIKKSNVIALILTFQIMSLLSYLFSNILSVGESGTGLPILILYILLFSLASLVSFPGYKLTFRLHFLVFLMYLLWVSLRVILDMADTEYLKAITFGTTGGILFFYIIGVSLSTVFFRIMKIKDVLFEPRIIFLFFLFLAVFLFYSYSEKLLDTLIFYIADVDGGYQRPGNFMSISFIIVSFMFFYYSLGIYKKTTSYKGFYFWFIIYSISTFLLLSTTQMIGSNSATVVVSGVFLITVVMSLVSINNVIINKYRSGMINLSNSKKVIKSLAFFSFLSLLLFSVVLLTIVSVTDFDIETLRLFGYGSGNTSISSRLDILLVNGLDQIGYSPFFGNINVALITTGNAGTTLHSFLPYVMANLGLVGLIMVCILYYMIFKQLWREVNKTKNNHQMAMINLFSLLILVFIFLFANISTGISWAVLNFSVGFFSKPIYFKKIKLANE